MDKVVKEIDAQLYTVIKNTLAIGSGIKISLIPEADITASVGTETQYKQEFENAVLTYFDIKMLNRFFS